MLSYFKKLFMGFDAKNVNVVNQTNTPPISNSKTIELNKQEVEFLLTLIKNSNFSGSVIEILYNTVYKLQEQHKKLNK
jgi:hypothetical protein